MTILDLLQSDGFTLRKEAVTSGGEYGGPCPWCGGDDRFRVWPVKGRYWCRQCDRKGDAIQYLRDKRGLSYPEACQALNLEPKPMTGGALPKIELPEWMPKPFTKPNPTWLDRARRLKDRAIDALWQSEHADRLQWLRNRGLSDRTILEFELGYCPIEYRETFRLWGFEGEGMVTIPRGIIIPCTRAGHGLFKLKIRRNNEDLGPDNSKYTMIISNYCDPKHDAPYAITCPNSRHYLIVESELDAILLWQEGYKLGIGAIALSGATKRPDSDLNERLMRATTILFCRDYDDAGKAALKWWQGRYLAVKSWTSSKGKDPSEAFQAGCDVRAWIRAGLPNPFPDLPGFEALTAADRETWKREVIRLIETDNETKWMAEQIAYDVIRTSE